jgi:uncharacterized membrane protein (DUF373 family)
VNFLKSFNIQKIFSAAINYLINILIVYIIIILVLGLGKTLLSVTEIFSGKLSDFNLSTVVSDILTFLVMIELFRSFVEYFKAKRFRLHSMLDPAIIFIVRELIVKLYSHEHMMNHVFFGFSALILTLGVIRTLAVCFSPEDEN